MGPLIYFSPKKEDVATKLKIEEYCQVLKAKKLFEECLIKNARGKRGASGRPEACEEVAKMFTMIVGYEALDEKTRVYNEIRDAYEPEEIFDFDVVGIWC